MQPQPERQSSYDAAMQQQQQQQQQQQEEEEQLAISQAIQNRQLAEKAAEEERQRAEQAAAEQAAAAQRAPERAATAPDPCAVEEEQQRRAAERVKEVREALRPRMITLGQKRKLLEALQVTAEAPESLTEDGRGKCERMLHFLAQTRRSDAKSQAAMSIHKTATGSVIHVADSEGISVFIEVPSGLDPVEVARQLLKGLKGGLDTAIGDRDPLTIFNGECRALNFKTIFCDKVTLRTQSSLSDGLAARIAALKATVPITEETLAIVDGIPSNATQTNSVFETAERAADWSEIAARWKEATQNGGFATQPGSAGEILNALQSKKHVLILIAHGDATELLLPSPEPDGSSLLLEDLEAIKEEISKNKPVVYMFCCESASFNGAQNWASELLRHGATAVYAPQDRIETENTRKLYESFLQKGRALDPLTATYQAEKESGCRELEMWVA
ncbi:MAG: hypothetical protein DME53_08025 [Verrucomicrobia bacterium]|nr:MAG: hypothetical protein DME53_08025 [Verrucomicrobiota bacterium]